MKVRSAIVRPGYCISHGPILGLTFMFGPAGLLTYLVVRLAMSRMKPKAA